MIKLTEEELHLMDCYINGTGTAYEIQRGKEIQDKVVQSIKKETEGKIAAEVLKMMLGN